MIEPLRSNASNEDLARLAMLHRESIEGGFLASLGDRFLIRLYRFLAKSHQAAVWVYRTDAGIDGFICGATSLASVYRGFAISSGPAVAFRLAPRVIDRRLARRLVETALYPMRKRPNADRSDAEVLNFCVAESSRGTGVGRKLFAAVCDDFRARGHRRLRIVTGATQESAKRFYTAAGADLVGRIEVHRGEPSLAYEYTLAPPKTRAA